eukprot:6766338-Pyramimonas_sp.AAC.1
MPNSGSALGWSPATWSRHAQAAAYTQGRAQSEFVVAEVAAVAEKGPAARHLGRTSEGED